MCYSDILTANVWGHDGICVYTCTIVHVRSLEDDVRCLLFAIHLTWDRVSFFARVHQARGPLSFWWLFFFLSLPHAAVNATRATALLLAVSSCLHATAFTPLDHLCSPCTFEALLDSTLEYFQLWEVCLKQGSFFVSCWNSWFSNQFIEKPHFVFLKDFILLNF